MSPQSRRRRRGQRRGGEGGEGGGGDVVGGRQPWQKGGGGIAAIAVNCGGSGGKQHSLGALARKGKERREERCGMGTSTATTGNLLGIVFWRGGRNRKEAEAMAVGVAKETTPGIQCWPQRRLVPRWWYCPLNNCRRPGTERGNADGDGDGNGNDASILCGQYFDVARCTCRGVHGSTRKNPPLETPSLICFLPPHPPERAVSRRASAGWASKSRMWLHVV